MSTFVQIDGSLGEGGGQVLRVALSLSVLHKIPIKISNIRMGRRKPGLAAQHLKGVELLKHMCNAEVSGAHIGSTTLEFKPGPFNVQKGQPFIADTGTAGCIPLLAQIALPCALFFPQKDAVPLILKGGTNVPMGPHIEYLTEVLRPLLNKFGADFDFNVVTRGYYPKGGGEIHLYVKPVHHLNAVAITDPGVPREILGWAYVSGVVPIREAQKIANDAKYTLQEGFDKYSTPLPPTNIEAYKEDRSMAIGNASGINIVCTTTSGCVFGGSGLGSGSQEQTNPGTQAARDVLETISAGSCVDDHAQDQLIIFMALAKGMSKINLGSRKLTCHTETAIKVTEIVMNKYNVHFVLHEKKDAEERVSYTLECEGCGYENKGAG